MPYRPPHAMPFCVTDHFEANDKSFATAGSVLGKDHNQSSIAEPSGGLKGEVPPWAPPRAGRGGGATAAVGRCQQFIAGMWDAAFPSFLVAGRSLLRQLAVSWWPTTDELRTRHDRMCHFLLARGVRRGKWGAHGWRQFGGNREKVQVLLPLHFFVYPGNACAGVLAHNPVGVGVVSAPWILYTIVTLWGVCRRRRREDSPPPLPGAAEIT
eukprot:gene22136-biopygen4201